MKRQLKIEPILGITGFFNFHGVYHHPECRFISYSSVNGLFIGNKIVEKQLTKTQFLNILNSLKGL